MIDTTIESELHKYLGSVCVALECTPVQIGGYTDHVHVLCMLSRKIAVIKLAEEIKKASSKWIKTKADKYAHFYWQDGYAAFAVGRSELDRVISYIQKQHEHHNQSSYQDECRKLFKRYDLEYDEKYVWD